MFEVGAEVDAMVQDGPLQRGRLHGQLIARRNRKCLAGMTRGVSRVLLHTVPTFTPESSVAMETEAQRY